ncbi:MAG: hypothetical protein LJE92_09435 [Gammaproteobacteria bacterium]|jgi:plastocyanin|nr:hypothetical protein [Gammaproteobacteria bacterium]
MTDARHTPYKPNRFALRLVCLGLFCLTAQSTLAETVTVEVRDPAGAAIEGIAVYLEALDREMPPEIHHATVEILQQNKGFVPYIGVVQAGSTVTFSNHDDITHHIYSVTGNKRFSFNLRAHEISPEMGIEQAGLIAMGCNIHDWMSGHLLVVDSPYYGVTNARGQTVIEIGDAGRYRIVTWHPQVRESVQKIVSLPALETVSLKLGQSLAAIPRQKGVDNFDFLEGY